MVAPSSSPGQGCVGAVTIRRFRPEDSRATAEVFFESVRKGAGDHYDAAQRRAWAPNIPEEGAWGERLSAQTSLVAICDDRVAGFMTFADDGYLDLAFVAPDMIGKGVAKKLYGALLEEARRRGVGRLYTHASHMARGFFLHQGWSVLGAQSVLRDNVTLENFLMEKIL